MASSRQSDGPWWRVYKDCSRKNSTFGLGKFKRLSGACTNHYLSHPPLDKRGAHWNNDYYFPKAYIHPALPVSVFMAFMCIGVGWRLQAHVCIHAYAYMPERCRRLLLLPSPHTILKVNLHQNFHFDVRITTAGASRAFFYIVNLFQSRNVWFRGLLRNDAPLFINSHGITFEFYSEDNPLFKN